MLQQPAGPMSTTDSSTSKRILVADDDPIVVQILERLLKENGHETFIACSGEQAVEIATTNEIDLAILDYRMPGISGLEAAKAIHSLTSTRFIMMSVHGDIELVMKAAGEGALAYIVKPLDTVEVLNTVSLQLVRADEIKRFKSSIQKKEEDASINMSRAVTTARAVNTAIGMLMERLRISHNEAFNMLRQQSRNTQRRLVDICQEMIRAGELNYKLEKEATHGRKPNRGKSVKD